MTSIQRNRVDWKAAARALAEQIPASALHAATLARAKTEAARERRRTGRPVRWAVAFSGGADSLALLL